MPLARHTGIVAPSPAYMAQHAMCAPPAPPANTNVTRRADVRSRYNTQVMSKDWIDDLTPENYPPLIIRKDGLDIRSEVTAVRRRPIKHGPSDYVTVSIKPILFS